MRTSGRATELASEAGSAVAEEGAVAPVETPPTSEEDTHSLKEVAVSDQLAEESASVAPNTTQEALEQAGAAKEDKLAFEEETVEEPEEPKELITSTPNV